METGRVFLGGSKIPADGHCSHEIKRGLLLGKKVMINLDSILKSRDITLPTEVHLVKAMVFLFFFLYYYYFFTLQYCIGFAIHQLSSSHVWMWELNYKESWAPKKWCFWSLVLEKTLESPLDYKEIQPVHPKGNHSWIFIGRTHAEGEIPILWPPDV